MLQKKMSLTSKLSQLEHAPRLPRVSTKELICEGGYLIGDVRRVETRYGTSIVVEINFSPEKPQAIVYLPPRFNAELTDDDLQEIKNGNFKIKCTGVCGRAPDILIYK